MPEPQIVLAWQHLCHNDARLASCKHAFQQQHTEGILEVHVHGLTNELVGVLVARVFCFLLFFRLRQRLFVARVFRYLLRLFYRLRRLLGAWVFAFILRLSGRLRHLFGARAEGIGSDEHSAGKAVLLVPSGHGEEVIRVRLLRGPFRQVTGYHLPDRALKDDVAVADAWVKCNCVADLRTTLNANPKIWRREARAGEVDEHLPELRQGVRQQEAEVERDYLLLQSPRMQVDRVALNVVPDVQIANRDLFCERPGASITGADDLVSRHNRVQVEVRVETALQLREDGSRWLELFEILTQVSGDPIIAAALKRVDEAREHLRQPVVGAVDHEARAVFGLCHLTEERV